MYSWDIVVTRVGDKLFFDKRDQSSLSLVTANETSPDPVPEEKDNINGVQQLSLEATMINQNFSQQVGGDAAMMAQSIQFLHVAVENSS